MSATVKPDDSPTSTAVASAPPAGHAVGLLVPAEVGSGLRQAPGSASAEEPAEAEVGPQPKPYDVGVLFVHGIGQQKRGETLVEFGDAVIEWMRCWIAEANPGRREGSWVTSVDAVLDGQPSRPFDETQIDQKNAPAHMRLELATSGANRPDKSPWLMAESWWADTFAPVSFVQLALWGFGVLPWTILTHFGAAIRHATVEAEKREHGWQRLLAQIWARFVLTPWYIFVALLVSVGVTPLILLLMILAVLPIPQLSSLVVRVQQILAGFLGDSYVLLISPVRKEAIVTRVRQDLEWMAQQCATVAVVAHSQGAAVSYMALKKCKLWSPEQARAQGLVLAELDPRFRFDTNQVLLLTFGSGLNKLENTRKALSRATGKSSPSSGLLNSIELRSWGPLCGFIGLISCGLYLYFNLFELLLSLLARLNSENAAAALLSSIRLDSLVGNLLASLGMLLYSWLLAYVLNASTREQLDPADFDPNTHSNVSLQWLDFYASQDPVSNGPLFDRTPRYQRSVKVFNRAWTFSDHSAYWQNRDGFVSEVVQALLTLATAVAKPSPRLPPNIDLACAAGRLKLARKRRPWRTQWLVATRLLALNVGLGLLWLLRDKLQGYGESVLAYTIEASTLLSGLLELLGIAFRVPSSLGMPILGGSSILLAVLAAYLIQSQLFAYWEWHDTAQLLSAKPYDLHACILYTIVGWGWLCLAAAAVIWGTAPLAFGNLPALANLGLFLFGVLPALALIGYMLGLISLVLSRGLLWATQPAIWRTVGKASMFQVEAVLLHSLFVAVSGSLAGFAVALARTSFSLLGVLGFIALPLFVSALCGYFFTVRMLRGGAR